MNKEEAIKYLTNIDNSADVIVHVWGVDDVYEAARELGYGMIPQLANDVLDSLRKRNFSGDNIYSDRIKDHVKMKQMGGQFFKLWKFYWANDDGGDCSYDVDKDRCFYFMSPGDFGDNEAMDIGYALLNELGLSDELEDGLFWTCWSFDDDQQEELEELLTEDNSFYFDLCNPCYVAINGWGTRICDTRLHKLEANVMAEAEDYLQSGEYVYPFTAYMLNTLDFLSNIFDKMNTEQAINFFRILIELRSGVYK